MCHAFDRFQFGDFSNKQNRDILIQLNFMSKINYFETLILEVLSNSFQK